MKVRCHKTSHKVFFIVACGEFPPMCYSSPFRFFKVKLKVVHNHCVVANLIVESSNKLFQMKSLIPFVILCLFLLWSWIAKLKVNFPMLLSFYHIFCKHKWWCHGHLSIPTFPKSFVINFFHVNSNPLWFCTCFHCHLANTFIVI
jgi:hypothetical protein